MPRFYEWSSVQKNIKMYKHTAIKNYTRPYDAKKYKCVYCHFIDRLNLFLICKNGNQTHNDQSDNGE